MKDDPVRRGDLSNTLRRGCGDQLVGLPTRFDSVGRERVAWCGGLRRSDARTTRRSRREFLDGLMRYEPAVVDDHHLVSELLHFCQHVTRDEHGLPRSDESPEEIAEPADPLRVETIRRLVQDEQLRIAE